MFGLGSYLIVTYMTWMGWRLLKARHYQGVGTKTCFFALFLCSSCILLNVIAETKWVDLGFLYDKVHSETTVIKAPLPVRYIRHNLGGVPFYYVYRDLPHLNLQHLLGNFGVLLTFSVSTVVSFILLTDMSFLYGMKHIMQVFSLFYESVVAGLLAILDLFKSFSPRKKKTLAKAIPGKRPGKGFSPPYKSGKPADHVHQAPFKSKPTVKTAADPSPRPPVKTISVKPSEPTEKSDVIIKNHQDNQPKATKTIIDYPYDVPPIELLSDTPTVDQTGLKIELQKRAQILEETLLSFGIEAKVGHIYSGPTITSFEVIPAIGVKVQKIKSLENDIALNLQAKSIRIIAPIPGKPAVGVEVPSLFPQEVGFKEMLIHYHQGKHKYHIPMLLGKTVSGDEVVCDLTKMPHCIIAGATGSGKSVCINTIIMSILMNMSPDEIRLILIDPKKVELTPFSKLPHLVAPVITEPAGAYAALQWIVKEMQFRYEVLKRIGVRHFQAFNHRKVDKEFEESLEIKIPDKMYYIVCIIDEFADLMMTSSADLETPIARIAQMARAVGIHLILATQRPSREVITGLIKANFPTRIAFKVSSRINSQIILDENGAETLLGNGDMLFLPPGTSQLIRCQGVFIRDEDINRVIDHIISKFPTQYILDSFDKAENQALFSSEKEDQNQDPLYQKALRLVLDHRVASATFLQRKLKIGYPKAASLMDELEQNGVIGPQDGSRPRKILKDFSDDMYE